MVHSIFRYLEPFRRNSRVWQTDRQTERHSRIKCRSRTSKTGVLVRLSSLLTVALIRWHTGFIHKLGGRVTVQQSQTTRGIGESEARGQRSQRPHSLTGPQHSRHSQQSARPSAYWWV